MHLSRGYPWTLNLSDRELTVIEKCLADEELTPDEVELAEHVLSKIVENRAKLSGNRRLVKQTVAANSTDDDDELQIE